MPDPPAERGQARQAEEREAHLRAMKQQLKWLEIEAARLRWDNTLIPEVLESLRHRIREMEAGRNP